MDAAGGDAPRGFPVVGPVPRELTEAQGLELLRRFVAGDGTVEPELVIQLNRLMYRVFQQRWAGSGLAFVEVRGDCFDVLARWRRVGKLRVEPLPHLAQRLVKQCARQQVRQRVKDKKLRLLDESGKRPKLARQAALWNPIANPEQALLGRELYGWLVKARERLSPAEREAYDALVKVAEGEAKSVQQALGIEDAAAWQRVRRVRIAIVELAKQDGMDQVVARWKKGRSPRVRKAEGE